jgi:glycosyltransferase involved in cell wall biosynthesis
MLTGAHADAARLFSAFDALVISSRTEGTPMIVLEAAVAGIPVVSTSVGGVPDLLEDGAGWLVPPGDRDALAQAIRAALDDPTERGLRGARLRARFAPAASDNDWVDQYLDLYRRLIAR